MMLNFRDEGAGEGFFFGKDLLLVVNATERLG